MLEFQTCYILAAKVKKNMEKTQGHIMLKNLNSLITYYVRFEKYVLLRRL